MGLIRMKKIFSLLLVVVLCVLLPMGVMAAQMSPGSDAPQTGDSTRIGPWIIIMVVALVVLIVLALLSRNKFKKD